MAHASANAELTVAASSAAPDVLITPLRPLPRDVFDMNAGPSEVPWRPRGPETIIVSRDGYFSRLLTELHELARALGLGHTRACSVMASIARADCRADALPTNIFQINQRARIAVWSPAPTPSDCYSSTIHGDGPAGRWHPSARVP